MQFINLVIQIFIHLDKYLDVVIRDFGAWTYLFLFVVIFCETGLVVTPFLPGDSLIFAAGAIAGLGSLDVVPLYLILALAAFLGDTANYWIGHAIGPRVFNEKIPFLKKEYLDRTHAFYEKHGGKTIIIARFIPIIRTFAPFIAGVGEMTYIKFISYNIIGGVLWTALFTFAGYFFGNQDFIRRNFSLVIIAIIIISILPAVIEYLRNRNKPAAAAE